MDLDLALFTKKTSINIQGEKNINKSIIKLSQVFMNPLGWFTYIFELCLQKWGTKALQLLDY